MVKGAAIWLERDLEEWRRISQFSSLTTRLCSYAVIEHKSSTISNLTLGDNAKAIVLFIKLYHPISKNNFG